MSDALNQRKSLPPDLDMLLKQYPRKEWARHENLGGMAKFWLQRHDMFRALGGELRKGTGRFQDGGRDPQEFWRWFAPRASTFLNELHGHHHIEDEHYFPVFRRAEKRLVRGFDILDMDHITLDQEIKGLADDANAFQRALSKRGDVRPAADRLHKRLEGMQTGVLRHLSDEEDLIIPVILDQGERKLGIR